LKGTQPGKVIGTGLVSSWVRLGVTRHNRVGRSPIGKRSGKVIRSGKIV
jgi:hypothetical protein